MSFRNEFGGIRGGRSGDGGMSVDGDEVGERVAEEGGAEF